MIDPDVASIIATRRLPPTRTSASTSARPSGDIQRAIVAGSVKAR
jgi:hypothetical protein